MGRLRSALILPLVLSPWAAFAGGPAAVTVTGVTVTGAAYAGDGDLRPLGSSPGTSVALLVVHGSRSIVRVDEEASKLDVVADDKGGDLHVGFRYASNFPKYSKDHKAVMLHLHFEKTPGKGATSIHLTGNLAVTTGGKTKVHKTKVVKLAKGAKLEAGPVPLSIEDFGPTGDTAAPLGIGIAGEGDIPSIAAIEFYDASGAKIDASLSSTFGSTTRMSWGYRLARQVDALEVRVSYYTDLTPETIPFDVKASVGL